MSYWSRFESAKEAEDDLDSIENKFDNWLYAQSLDPITQIHAEQLLLHLRQAKISFQFIKVNLPKEQS